MVSYGFAMVLLPAASKQAQPTKVNNKDQQCSPVPLVQPRKFFKISNL
jgi:hypothetical protein